MEHKKPKLHDAPIDRKTMLDLEKLFEANKDAFVEDERQIDNTPLIKCLLILGMHAPLLRNHIPWP